MTSVLDSRTLRNLLGHFATGVIIVTARTADGQRIGMTMSSFNTVSLDPPLILFSIHRNALSLPAWQTVEKYAVNILGAAQEEVANRFARAKDDKWEGTKFEEPEGLSPHIAGSIAVLQCDAHARYDGGDHEIFLGRITSHKQALHAAHDPLLFFGGKFRNLAAEQGHAPADDAIYLHGW
ncbi:flavin reductase (DIM6/NTAB) family NADH-FMN oxidoreductase RutF [Bradyrhizobium sp. LB8.2]|uniref:flavin reductase family protein n=1 Tax=unclassified Bradyrhizobium TaxID=2631580 RepID=UPI0033954E16